MSAELPAELIAANADLSMEVVRAYIGPGSGIGAVGALAALVATGVLMVIGFLWYPVKRILRSRRKNGKNLAGGDHPRGGPGGGRLRCRHEALGLVSRRPGRREDSVMRASSVIADSTLDDLEKEKLVQRHALLLLRRSLLITLRAAAVFGSPVLLLAAMHWLDLAKLRGCDCASARMGGHCRHLGRIPGRVGGLVGV